MRRKVRLRRLIVPLLAGAVVTAATAQETPAPGSGVEGFWLTEKRKVVVELSACGDALCGRIVWLAKSYTREGDLKRDVENPDPALRDRPWCGIAVITGLHQAAPGVWEDGIFYYPKDGRRYDIEIEQAGDALRVYAFLGIRLLGKKERWTRVMEDLPGCVSEG